MIRHTDWKSFTSNDWEDSPPGMVVDIDQSHLCLLTWLNKKSHIVIMTSESYSTFNNNAQGANHEGDGQAWQEVEKGTSWH